MKSPTETIEQILKNKWATFTRAELQLANLILENYPVSGMGSITTIAENAGVSTPTVARMVQKLGFSGYPEFQTELRNELNAKISSPISKRENLINNTPDEHIINRFTEATLDNIYQSLQFLEIESFDGACDLLSDENRGVYIVGGRITQALAGYLYMHMQIIRKNVSHIESISTAWPHYLLNIEEGDILIVFDIRRYENSTLKLAEIAHEKGAEIILFTDQWRSPVSKFASYTFCNRIEVPSAWDSSVTTLLLLESMIAALQEKDWTSTKERIEDLEDMFDRTKFFRKFT